MYSTLVNFDGNILLFIQEYLRTPFLTPIFKFITSLGNGGAVWIAATIILLCFRKTRKAGILSAIALILSLVVDNLLLKNLVARTRPYEVIEGLKILIKKPHDYSFPSGHTGSSFAAAVIFFLTLPKKYGIPAMVLAFLIGLSRLYLGVHYPSDVISGAIIGTVIAFTVYKIYLYFFDKKNA